MKRNIYNIFMMAIAMSVMFACTEEAETPSLQTTSAYVQFDDNTVGDAEDGVIALSEPSAGTSTQTLTVENPFGVITSDITVNYTLGGDAEFGVDYTIADATASGGNFVIVNRQDTLENGNPSNSRDSFDLEIELLSDGVQDGGKNLVVTLTSASASGVEVNTTRSGLADRSELTLQISDSDCGFARGQYDVNGNILVDDFGSGPYNYTEFVVASNCPDESMYNIVDITGGLYSNAYAANYSTSPASAIITIDEGTGAVTWSGVSDQFGGEVVEDPAAPETSNYDSGTGVITIYWTATSYGERGITTYTLQ